MATPMAVISVVELFSNSPFALPGVGFTAVKYK